MIPHREVSPTSSRFYRLDDLDSRLSLAYSSLMRHQAPGKERGVALLGTSIAHWPIWFLGAGVALTLVLNRLDVVNTWPGVANLGPLVSILAGLWGAMQRLWLGRRHSADRRSRAMLVRDVCAIMTVALIAPAVAQLTAVVHPGTLGGGSLTSLYPISSPIEVPSLPDGIRTILLVVERLLVVSFVVYSLSLLEGRESRRRSNPIASWTAASVLALGLCLALPVLGPWRPTCSLAPAGAFDSGVAAASTLPRLGLVSFPLLWTSLAVFACWPKGSENAASRRLKTVGAGGWFVVAAIEVLAAGYSLAAIALSVALAGAFERWFGSLGTDAASERIHHRGVAVEPIGKDAREELLRAALASIFFVSGFAALIYQVVFAKKLALCFGSTSHATTTVLATYMAGLALGSYVGGRVAERTSRPVRWYAATELGVAAICAMAPLTVHLAQLAYIGLAAGRNPAEPLVLAVQFMLGAMVLMPPTFLMGMTLPLLTKRWMGTRGRLGSAAAVLYASNTLGAALGAIAAGYALLPWLGISRSLGLAVALNLFAGAVALSPALTRSPVSEGPQVLDQEPEAGTEVERSARVLGILAVVLLGVGGAVTFGLETTYVHLLATVAGTSTYAFSLMLFAFLIGLGAGSALGRLWLERRLSTRLALLLCPTLLAMVLVVSIPIWQSIPDYFADFGDWAPARSFAAREFLRFVVCCLMMLPPALCIGAQFPIAMEAVGRSWPDRRVRAMGWTSALNTLGNIFGAVVVGFVCLPRLGSMTTLRLVVFVCLALGVLIWITASGIQRSVAAPPLVACVAGIAILPQNFDFTRLTSGGNVYFRHQGYGTVIDHAESLDGGLTTVALSRKRNGTLVHTLLTNGKFQGNDRRDSSGELVAQSSFALAPLLHTTRRGRALVIGFGTGTTTRVLSDAGFRRVDVAELSADMVRLANQHFSSVNGGVAGRANVHIHIADGRNYLLLDRGRYDLITIELSSIWFAGAAALYNDEFYQLVADRLAPGGILQQWVQLHHLSKRDVVTILATAQRRFPNVWLYFLGKQGIIVACRESCPPSASALRKLDSTPSLGSTLALFGGSVSPILDARLLDPSDTRTLIDDFAHTQGLNPARLISTDDNLELEYSTPRGNVRDYDQSLQDNLGFVGAYRHGLSSFLPLVP